MQWRSHLIVALSLVLAVSARAAEPINPDNPPEGLFTDEWGEVYMAGGKVGYVHSTMTRKGDLIDTRVMMKMVIGRANQAITVQTDQSTTESLTTGPIKFTQEMDASIMKTAMRGTIKNGRVTIVQSQYGMETTQTFDYPQGAVMVWGTFRESLRRGFEPGTTYTLSTYIPELRMDGPLPATTTVGNWEEFEHDGKRIRGQRVDLVLESHIGPIEMVNWVDHSGQILKSVMPMPGLGDIVIVMTDQGTALADFVPPEVFMTSIVKAKRTITPRTARRITYRIRSTTPGTDLGEIPTTDMQVPTKAADHSVKLVITRQEHAFRKPRAERVRAVDAGAWESGGEMAEFLESNLMINTKDPKLIALAKEAAGRSDDPFTLADNLRRFVTDYVDIKNLNIGFATASEVCRTREGDCSEHGVLLAALGRINGLPSRVAVGLAYVPWFGGQKDVFGYHMWTQFYIDGRWIDVDAALRETKCSPTRIAFATSSLKNTGLADLSLPLLSKIGAIDIDILNIEESPDGGDH